MPVGFTGFAFDFTCPNPNPPQTVTFPGNGTYTPGNFLCDAQNPGSAAYAGLDGDAHAVWSGHPSGDSLAIEAIWALGDRTGLRKESVTGQFAVAADGFDAPMTAGVCCLVSADPTPDGTAKGFAFFLDTVNNGHAVKLVQMNTGFSYSPGGSPATTYTLLAAQENAWSAGDFITLTLEWYSDPLQLKGTYLRALWDETVLSEIVYAGGNAYTHTGTSQAGIFGQAASNRVVIYHQ